jgi:hypothetical protein
MEMLLFDLVKIKEIVFCIIVMIIDKPTIPLYLYL